jgi:hypothetical protein
MCFKINQIKETVELSKIKNINFDKFLGFIWSCTPLSFSYQITYFEIYVSDIHLIFNHGVYK